MNTDFATFFQSATWDFPVLHVLTSTHHGFTPLQMTAKGHSPGWRHNPLDEASQDMGPMLTMLSLLVRPLHLHVNLCRNVVFHDDLVNLVLHTLVEHH